LVGTPRSCKHHSLLQNAEEEIPERHVCHGPLLKCTIENSENKQARHDQTNQRNKALHLGKLFRLIMQHAFQQPSKHQPRAGNDFFEALSHFFILFLFATRL
jgi:hypothetical protein